MLRFTIRDILWLTVAVAPALGWWLNRHMVDLQMANENASLQESLDAKVKELALIEVVIREPRDGENTIESIRDILANRSYPQATFMCRPPAKTITSPGN